jgi:hypothetical protein
MSITDKELGRMDQARDLLPPPGGEVVGKLITEVRRLTREVRYLRLYGNHDCTAMADAAMAAETKEPCQVCGGSGIVNTFDGPVRESSDMENWPGPCPACRKDG